MNLIQLRCFCAVADEGSFSRAARTVFVTQPAISMQVKALEEELGETLLERGKRHVRLTDVGRTLYHDAVHILAMLDSARLHVQEIRGLQRGHLTTACSDTLSTYVLPPVLAGFSAAYPSLAITVHNRTSPQIVELVLDGTADVGLITLPISNPRLTVRTLFAYREIAVCSPNHPIAEHRTVNLADLSEHRILILEEGTKSRSLFDEKLGALGLVPQSRMEVGSVEVQKAFAQIGLGVAIVPDFSIVHDGVPSHLAVREITDLPARRIGMVTRTSPPLSRAAQEFAHWMTTSDVATECGDALGNR